MSGHGRNPGTATWIRCFFLGRGSGFGGRFSEPRSIGALIVVERSGKCTGLGGSPRLDLERTALVG